jgi:DNA-binding SARP family transcriptional activator/WD40 repeat protein
MDCRVLGPLEVLVDGRSLPLGGPKQRVVVGVLLAAAGRPVSVDVLLEAIYGEDAAPGGRRTLQTYVSNLRQVLGDVIGRQGDAYLLRCGGSEIDSVEFEECYRAASAMTDADGAASMLRAALVMWRGHPYADVEAHGVLDGEITRLGEVRLAALEARIEADLSAGRHREVIAELEALTVEHPWRESLRAMHMLALYRSGRQTEALRAFGRTRVVLAEGLGIDPSPELQDLERRILVQDRSLLISAGPAVLRRAVLVADLDDAAGWSDPWERESAFARRELDLAAVADREGGRKLAPKGSAGYAVFSQPIHAVRAARALVDGRMRVAVDFGDLEVQDDDPVGPPLARAARLVAVAHPGQALLSADAHEALTIAGVSGWAAESLGRFDIVGLDAGVLVYQFVGDGFASGFPALLVDRLPPSVPGVTAGSVPGYELRDLIGTGELGDVHRAYQPAVGREVAVRIFGPWMVRHPQFVRRFESGSQRIARVDHPHVLPLLDYWREPSRAVMVSRLVRGGHLGQRIPAHGMDPVEALALIEKVAAGIGVAHRLGVVHGRLRPENVLFDDDANPYVADLGIDEICTGIVSFATHAYDAPERLGGTLATPASDIYALGVLIHEVLSGSPPPLDGALPLRGDAVDAVVAKATDPDPGGRNRSVDELVDELREALAVAAMPSAVFVPTRNPYRGLAAFEEADASDFHGRTHVVGEMVDMLRRERLLVVFGPSGIGKSSVVNAGLVPALRRGAVEGSESWLCTEMTPGRDPFEQLRAALARIATVTLPDVVDELSRNALALDEVVRRVVPRGTDVVVIIDQFEELFTHTGDDEVRRAFVRMLVDTAGARDAVVRIIVTLRADFLDRPLGYIGFADAITGRTLALGAMSAAELAEAICRPATAVGVAVEPALVERITADAESAPGALPLVQHQLAELFAQRTTNVLTLAAYDESGGLVGAIGRRAEATYLELDDRTRSATRAVFLRLVSVDEEHADTRRRVRRAELEQSGIADDELKLVLSEYGRHRLLTFDRDAATRTPTVEVAHEALLSEWARFKGWIDDARHDLLTRRRIEAGTNDWLLAGSDSSFLITGSRLELAEAWAAESGFELSENEQRFLTASRTRVDRDTAARTTRRRRITQLLVGAVVAMAALAVYALVQRSAADHEARDTRARELAGQAQLAIGEDPERAIMLALAANETTDQPLQESVSALQAAIQPMRLLATVDGVASSSLEYHPDGTMVAVDRADSEPGVILIDPVNGEVLADVPTDHATGIDGIAFDPGGAQMAVAHAGSSGDAIRVFEVPSGRPVATFTGPAGTYEQVSYHPNGRWLGAVRKDDDGSEREIVVWAVDSPGAPISLQPGTAFGFLPGTMSMVIARSGDHAMLSVVNVETSDVVSSIETPDIVDVFWIAVDPTGHRLALLSVTGERVVIVDLDRGETVEDLVVTGWQSAEFSPDGRSLAIGSWDNLVHLFDTENFAESRLPGSPNLVAEVAFAPDSSRLASISAGQLRLWELAPEGHHALGNFHTSGSVAELVVGDGEFAAATLQASDDSVTIERIDLATGEGVRVAAGLHYQPNNMGPLISADLHVATGLDDENRSHVIDFDTGADSKLGRCDVVRALDHSGRLALIDGQILCEAAFGQAQLPGPGVHSRVLDLRTGRTVLDLGARAMWSGVFGPPAADGIPGLVAVLDDVVTVYRLPDGQRVGTYSGFALAAAFTADGRRLAMTNGSGQLAVIDIARLAADPEHAVVWTAAAHTGSVMNIATSATGLIATGAFSGNVRVWSPEGTLVADIPVQLGGKGPALTFASGTDILYYEDHGGVIRRFTPDTAQVTALARSLLTRGFTPAECARYFPGKNCPTFTQ